MNKRERAQREREVADVNRALKALAAKLEAIRRLVENERSVLAADVRHILEG